MYNETKKLHLIEQLLKIDDYVVLDEVDTIISKNTIPVSTGRRSFSGFAGMMTDEEANEFEKIINDGCEQIYPDDWK